MNEGTPGADVLDTGLQALCGVAAFYRVPADARQLARELTLGSRLAGPEELVRAARLLGLRARVVGPVTAQRLAGLPLPALVQMNDGTFAVLVARTQAGACRLVDPVTRLLRELAPAALLDEIAPLAVLVTRRFAGAGADPKTFGFRWFLPSIWRYRRPIAHVLAASLVVQLFALVTPLFFQVVIDKVLTHRATDTLAVLIVGLVVTGLFDTALQFLRSYALAHTANRIDVELGRRLYRHLLRLPLSYFETRAAGQTVARVRELETVRQFLTGQALFSGLDLLFAAVFVAVLLLYSVPLTLIVLATIPVYVGIGVVVRPLLRQRIKEKFDRGAASQQFLVESVVGMPTVKGAAVEPIMQAQWEERLAAYVSTSFAATMLAAGGWPDAIPAEVRLHEEHVLAADMAQLGAQVDSLAAQVAQKHAEAARLTAMIAAETVLVATTRERVTMRESLMATNAGSKSSLIDALEALQTQQTTLVQQQGQLAEADAAALVSGRDIERAYKSFIADNAQKLSEAERQAADDRQRLAKAQAHLDHLTLRSPISGTVTASVVTGAGQVLTTGEEAMRIVADKEALEVECYLANRDIGFVRPGDHAVLKIESFPFTRYGTIEATVTKVAHDAIPQPDAEQIEGDGTRKGQPPAAGGGQRTQNLVFAVTLRPAHTTIDVDGATVPLGPGMAVTAEIRTGSRRILEYVVSPLVKVATQAMKER